MHNGCEVNNKNNNRKEIERENVWLQPKRCVSKKHVCETRGRKEHNNKNNNRHEEFSDEEEKEEEQEYCKRSNEKKSSDSVMRNKKYKCKENKSYEDEGDYASVQLIKKLKGDVEKACAMCENLQKDSIYTEVRHETLLENLKDELFRVMHDNEDEDCLEVEDTMKNIEKEFYLDVREEYFEGRKKIVEAKEIVEVMKTKEREGEATREKDIKF